MLINMKNWKMCIRDRKLKDKNIGILITDHNALETLRLTDRAYLLFEGKILFQGTPEMCIRDRCSIKGKSVRWKH